MSNLFYLKDHVDSKWSRIWKSFTNFQLHNQRKVFACPSGKSIAHGAKLVYVRISQKSFHEAQSHPFVYIAPTYYFISQPCVLFVFCFSVTGDWTKGLVHARGILHPQVNAPSPGHIFIHFNGYMLFSWDSPVSIYFPCELTSLRLCFPWDAALW